MVTTEQSAIPINFMSHSLLILMLALLIMNPARSAEETSMTDRIPANHPRILLTEDRVTELKERLKHDKHLQDIHAALLALGDNLLTQPPLERKLAGTKRFRLLSVSRQALARSLVLGTLYRLDGQEKWRARLLAELKAVCAFEDWHPAHFLDTAEMAAAVALGYDWLYTDLKEADRTFIRDGLIRHGLEPGVKGGWWVKSSNNWNQVCHCGMVLTALALAPERMEDCQELLRRARTHHTTGLAAYAPGGVYPEGPGYWTYGTSFSVLMASALDSTIGDSWGLLEAPGFQESFFYRMHVQSPTGRVVNYADGGDRAASSPYHFFLAGQTGTPGFAAFALETIQKDLLEIERTKGKKHTNRLLALAMAWYVPEKAAQTAPLDWFGTGNSKVHVAFMRSAWNDPGALFASLKAGDLQVSHGHLDNGSFIIESHGVRWASDMGSEREIYDRNDSWSTAQDSHRWKFFRANNFGHNTLSIGGRIQQVAGQSPIIATGSGSNPFAITDLSAAYRGQASSVKRGMMMPARKTVVIRDEITGVAAGEVVRWNMMTYQTDIKLDEDGQTVTLSQAGKEITGRLISPPGARFTVLEATPPRKDENPNQGWRRLVVDALSSGEDMVIAVAFLPDAANNAVSTIPPLDQWKSAVPQVEP